MEAQKPKVDALLKKLAEQRAQLDKLLAEHKELNAMLTVIQEHLRQNPVEDGDCLRRFKEDFVKLMSLFNHHEVAERELLMEVFWLEGGVSE